MVHSPVSSYLTSILTSNITSFHPSVQQVKAILESSELGAIASITAKLMLPKLIKETDIYDLGGGALMDMGCAYTIKQLLSPMQD